ncbi:MAG: DUF3050 domain-containing protein [Sphingobacteriaceae bacterium]|nr:MAG: DUF3050 domain-containing protein [Pedobacter sp.]
MKERIDQIKKNIEPLRQEIINHRVYAAIHNLHHLHTFMQYHVFAVWDFMSLLKSLQNNLTCTSTPWFPRGSAETRYLINEIVTGEESDLDQFGNRKSHFELYLEAMSQCGASTLQIEDFITTLKETNSFSTAFTTTEVHEKVRDFINFTFKIVKSSQVHLQSAVFTFGREDLIPQMFLSIVNDLHTQIPENKLSIFKYYLERHIQIDGEHHSKLALEMTARLCGSNELFWQEAEQAIIESLQHRIELWDGVYRQLSS